MSAKPAAYTATPNATNRFLWRSTEVALILSPFLFGRASGTTERAPASPPSAEEGATFSADSIGVVCPLLAGANKKVAKIEAPKKCWQFTKARWGRSRTAPNEFANALPPCGEMLVEESSPALVLEVVCFALVVAAWSHCGRGTAGGKEGLRLRQAVPLPLVLFHFGAFCRE
jgi:hypothetical protein